MYSRQIKLTLCVCVWKNLSFEKKLSTMNFAVVVVFHPEFFFSYLDTYAEFYIHRPDKMSEDYTEAPLVSAEPDMIEIKLFGRWSTSDVQVSDISLTVMFP